MDTGKSPERPIRPEGLHDRDDEWAQLVELWESSRFELAFMVGRRRVGKTALLVPFARQVAGLYYQATRRTEAEQLRSITRLVAEQFDDPALRHGSGFGDWEALFAYLLERVGDGRFLVVLDEFPYLESAASAMTTELQKVVDHQLPGTAMKLILSGSHVSAMKQLERADHPLYQRRTSHNLVLTPFTYRDAAAFFPEYSPRDRLKAYGVFGGVPGHLTLLDPGRTFEWNGCRHVLDPSGRLLDEAGHMLDAFLSEAEVPYSILEAIAAGQHTWSGITSRTGKPGGTISRPMQWLRDMNFVRREVPVTSPRPAKSKRALYRIADPYVRFWHRFVSPLIEAGIPGHAPPEQVWKTRVEPDFASYMGPVFEEACRSWVRAGPDLLPFTPLRVGRWWDGTSENEVDVVALSGDGELLVGECKWGRPSTDDVRELERRADLLVAELGGVRRTHLALFTGRTVEEHSVEQAVRDGELLHFTPEDLF